MTCGGGAGTAADADWIVGAAVGQFSFTFFFVSFLNWAPMRPVWLVHLRRVSLAHSAHETHSVAFQVGCH